MRDINMEKFKDKVMQYKAKISKIDEEAMKLGAKFQEEQKKRDNIEDKESAQYELQNNITEEVLKELQEKNQERNRLEDNVKDVIKDVRTELNNNKEEIAKKTLELQSEKKRIEKEISNFEELNKKDEANPNIKDNDQIMENRSKKISELKDEMAKIEVLVPKYINLIAEIDKKLEYIDYDNIENYQPEKAEKESTKQEEVKKEPVKPEKAEKESTKQEEVKEEPVKPEKAEKESIKTEVLRTTEPTNREAEKTEQTTTEPQVWVPQIYISEKDSSIHYINKYGKQTDYKTYEAYGEKKTNFYRLGIKQMCRDIAGGKMKALMLRRKVNPEIIKALSEDESSKELIEEYISAIHNGNKLPFDLTHDLTGTDIINRFKLRRYVSAEEKVGATILGKMFNKNRALKEKNYEERQENENSYQTEEEKILMEMQAGIDRAKEAFEKSNRDYGNIHLGVYDLNGEDIKDNFRNQYKFDTTSKENNPDVLIRQTQQDLAKNVQEEMKKDKEEMEI